MISLVLSVNGLIRPTSNFGIRKDNGKSYLLSKTSPGNIVCRVKSRCINH